MSENICCRCRRYLSGYFSYTGAEFSWSVGCFDTRRFLKQTRFYYPGEYAGDPSTPLCDNCWDYLHDRESRKAIDKEHFNVAHDTSSRYSPLCREFDIKYGLLDESTKLYWDEKPVRLVRSFSQENRQRRQNQWNGNHQNQNLGNLFHKNANELIRSGSLFRQSGTAAYEMVKTAAMKGSQPDFVSSFQAYIVHLGLAISDVCTKKFHGKKFTRMYWDIYAKRFFTTITFTMNFLESTHLEILLSTIQVTSGQT